MTENSTSAAFILAKVGKHPSDRMFLRFENSKPVWTGSRVQAAPFVDEASALAMVDRKTGAAFEGGVTFKVEAVQG